MNCEYLYKKGVHRGERCKGLCYIERYCYKHRDKINENINIPIIRIVKESDDQKRDDILNLKTSNNNKLVILKHYNNMKKSDPNSTEYYKNQIFIDTAMSYPWSKMYNIKDKIMDDILLAKFTQIPIAKQVLLLTHDAILLHGTRGIPISRQFNIEKVRNKLKNI